MRETYRLLGRRPPSLRWAKTELFLGLGAAVFGLRLLFGGDDLAPLGAALVLLGSYLALAGHRSHVYDAMTRQTTLLLHAVPQPAAPCAQPPAASPAPPHAD